MGPYDDAQLPTAAGITAPPTLFTGAMARISALDPYLTPQQNSATRHDAAGLSSLSPLFAATRDPRWEVRAAAVQALGKYAAVAPSAQIDAALTAALQDEHALTRLLAVYALMGQGQGQGQGTHAPIEQLAQATHDPDAEVREAALAALQRLQRQQDMPQRADVAALVPSPAALAAFSTLWRLCYHFWLTLLHQWSILQRRWLLTVFILLVSYGLVIAISLQPNKSLMEASLALAVTTTLASAFGVTFTSDGKHDAGMEVALSTPTSQRVILLGRYLLLIGSNTALALGASAVVALLNGQGLWGIVQVWLGPLLLLSSLALALTLWLGAWLAFLLSALLALAQTLRFTPDGHFMLVAHAPLWQTSPLTLFLALLCLLIAFAYMPRRTRLAQEPCG